MTSMTAVISSSAVEVARSSTVVSASGAVTAAVTSTSVTAANSVVDVQDNLSTNREIEVRAGITGEEFDLTGKLGTSEEDNLDTVSITGKAAIAVDNPDEFDAFDDSDNICLALGTE